MQTEPEQRWHKQSRITRHRRPLNHPRHRPTHWLTIKQEHDRQTDQRQGLDHRQNSTPNPWSSNLDLQEAYKLKKGHMNKTNPTNTKCRPIYLFFVQTIIFIQRNLNWVQGPKDLFCNLVGPNICRFRNKTKGNRLKEQRQKVDVI